MESNQCLLLMRQARIPPSLLSHIVSGDIAPPILWFLSNSADQLITRPKDYILKVIYSNLLLCTWMNRWMPLESLWLKSTKSSNRHLITVYKPLCDLCKNIINRIFNCIFLVRLFLRKRVNQISFVNVQAAISLL